MENWSNFTEDTILTHKTLYMKTVTMHSTQTKKTYRQPTLNKFGSVSNLTKGKLGSAFDGPGAEAKFDGQGES